MPVQPLARLNSGAAFCTPLSNSASMPGLMSICAISRTMFDSSKTYFESSCPAQAGHPVFEGVFKRTRTFTRSTPGTGLPAFVGNDWKDSSRRRLSQSALERGDRLLGGLQVAEVGIEGP